jgi:transcriptional regulator with XRE-family HTH domain
MRYSALRERIRRARREQSLTQEALARRSGVSRVTLARLEAGSTRDARAETVARVCEALGLEATAVPAGAPPALERALAREKETVRRLERRLAHAGLAARLLAARPAEARALVARARAVVDRWERDRLCSRHYTSRWKRLLAGPRERVARSLLEPGDWRDALFQTTPWSFALERPVP